MGVCILRIIHKNHFTSLIGRLQSLNLCEKKEALFSVANTKWQYNQNPLLNFQAAYYAIVRTVLALYQAQTMGNRHRPNTEMAPGL